MVRITALVLLALSGILDADAGKHFKYGPVPVIVQQPELPVDYQVRDKDCAPGFHLSGKQCVSTDVVGLQYRCPPGFDQLPGRCASFVPSIRNCPPQYRPIGETCQLVNILPPQEVCPPGSMSHGGWCKSSLELAPVCPHGLDGPVMGMCSKEFPAIPKCPNGYKMHPHKGCVRFYEGHPVCLPGTSLAPDASACVRMITDPPQCPPGTQMAGDGCEASAVPTPAPCPYGSSPCVDSPTHCESSSATPAAPVCPPGFALEGEQCAQTTQLPPFCPSGFQSDGRECLRRTPCMTKCPPSFESVDNSCRKVVPHPKVTYCADGYEMAKDQCKVVEYAEALTQCPTGARRSLDGCMATERREPKLQCPDGSVLSVSNGMPVCESHVSVDCSETTYKEECTVDLGHQQHHSSPPYGQSLYGSGRLLQSADHQLSGYMPQAVSPHSTTKGVNCRRVPVHSPKTCTRTETHTPSTFCPEGSFERGGSCVVERRVDSTSACAPGYHMDAQGRCFRVQVVPVMSRCPEGTTQSGPNCVVIDIVPSTHYCPTGYVQEYDVCVQRVQPTVPSPIRSTRPIQFVCSLGSLQGRSCVVVERVPRPLQCIAPFVQVAPNMCTRHVARLPPTQRMETSPVEFACYDGRTGKKCFEITEVREFLCPHGTSPSTPTIMEFTSCVKSVPAIQPHPKLVKSPAQFVCPPGFAPDGSSSHPMKMSCVSTQVAPFLEQCPVGFVAVDTSRCAKYSQPIAFCPPGYEQSAEGCIARRYQPPVVTLVKTCTKGEPGCH